MNIYFCCIHKTLMNYDFIVRKGVNVFVKLGESPYSNNIPRLCTANRSTNTRANFTPFTITTS